jgi:hypothetical protein
MLKNHAGDDADVPTDPIIAQQQNTMKVGG